MRPTPTFWLVLLACWAAGAVAAAAAPSSPALAVAKESGLADAPCPGAAASALPSWFALVEDGKTRQASAAVLLPAPAADLARRLDAVADWASWLFVSPGGQPNLRDLAFDEATGRTAVRLGDDEADVLSGTVTRTPGSPYLLRIALDDQPNVHDLAVEVGVIDRACDTPAALVTVRLSWSFGWKARVFAGGGVKLLPGLVLLALRDDLVAAALADPAVLSALLEAPVERGDDGGPRVAALEAAAPPPGATAAATGGAPAGEREQLRAGDRLVRVVPRVLTISASARRELEALQAAASKESLEGFVRALYTALSRPHAISGLEALVRRGDETLRVAPRPVRDDEAVVAIAFEGTSLSVGLHVPPR